MNNWAECSILEAYFKLSDNEYCCLRLMENPEASRRALWSKARFRQEGRLCWREEVDNMTDKPGLVYLVGAGPGDPGLLTVRGLECLRKADLIIHDRLVSPSLLHAAPPNALRLCVNELASRHSDRWPIVNKRMIAAARAGSTVVRLKGGDPAIFAHLAEETAALRPAGIAYEIVPGVTAALGAAAYSELPLTHRDLASTVAFVTGHENPGKSDSLVDWACFARFPGTLVLYMSMARIDSIVDSLLKGGKEATTPAIVIQNSTRGDEVEVRTTLAELPVKVKQAGLNAACIIVVGPVVDLKPILSWSQKRPLAGVRVLVARPLEQGLLLARRLEELGTIPSLLLLSWSRFRPTGARSIAPSSN